MTGLSSLCYNCRMEKKVYTTDELNNASREDLVGIVLSLQGSIARMMENQELIMEQISLLRQQRFGRHSEKMDVIDGQISLFFNEPEADAAQPGSGAQEPELEEVVIRRKKRKKGKREDDLKIYRLLLLSIRCQKTNQKQRFRTENTNGSRMKFIKGWSSIRPLLK